MMQEEPGCLRKPGMGWKGESHHLILGNGPGAQASQTHLSRTGSVATGIILPQKCPNDHEGWLASVAMMCLSAHPPIYPLSNICVCSVQSEECSSGDPNQPRSCLHRTVQVVEVGTHSHKPHKKSHVNRHIIKCRKYPKEEETAQGGVPHGQRGLERFF